MGPIYEALGPNRATALPGFHTLTGCDTTGHIQNKSKSTYFAKFMKASDDILQALSSLGVGNEPDEHVLAGCKKFLCQIFLPKHEYSRASDVRWHCFKHVKALKPNQGMRTFHQHRDHGFSTYVELTFKIMNSNKFSFHTLFV